MSKERKGDAVSETSTIDYLESCDTFWTSSKHRSLYSTWESKKISPDGSLERKLTQALSYQDGVCWLVYYAGLFISQHVCWCRSAPWEPRPDPDCHCWSVSITTVWKHKWLNRTRWTGVRGHAAHFYELAGGAALCASVLRHVSPHLLTNVTELSRQYSFSSSLVRACLTATISQLINRKWRKTPEGLTSNSGCQTKSL